MSRLVRAELIRLVRRRTLVIMAAGSLLLSVVATVAVFSSAQTSGTVTRQGGTTLAVLQGHGGGTEAFAVGASFTGFLVFVTFIALIATEFSGGTFRALLLRDPRRVRVLVGKLAGILVVAAATVALAEFFTFLVSLALAPAYDISTSGWFSIQSVGAALANYVTVFAGVVGWAIYGTMLAVIFRAAPVALAVGFAWAGPFENVVSRSWSAAYRLFPGQVLDSLIEGGTAELGLARAVATAVLYAAIAGAVALTLVSRRDVTA